MRHVFHVILDTLTPWKGVRNASNVMPVPTLIRRVVKNACHVLQEPIILEQEAIVSSAVLEAIVLEVDATVKRVL